MLLWGHAFFHACTSYMSEVYAWEKYALIKKRLRYLKLIILLITPGQSKLFDFFVPGSLIIKPGILKEMHETNLIITDSTFLLFNAY